MKFTVLILEGNSLKLYQVMGHGGGIHACRKKDRQRLQYRQLLYYFRQSEEYTCQLVDKLTWSDKMYLYPISNVEMSKNSLLKQILIVVWRLKLWHIRRWNIFVLYYCHYNS